jgi:hypothetical protein
MKVHLSIIIALQRAADVRELSGGIGSSVGRGKDGA